MIKGQIIGGDYSNLIVRQKSDQGIELGELFVADVGYDKVLFKVIDLSYGSQLSRQNLELMSGMDLEEETDLEFMEPELRNYTLASMKSILHIKGKAANTSKILPDFFSKVRELEKEDLDFMITPDKPINVGKIRSGSKVLDFPILLDGEKVFSEHILVAATTGRGKSNLTKCVLWDIIDKDYCGLLVLDPHDEYYGRSDIGLKEHPAKNMISYYSPKNPPAGQSTLKINLSLLKPSHFNGSMNLSDPQKEALYAYYKKYKDTWVEAVVLEKELDHKFHEATLGVVKRKIMSILGLEQTSTGFSCRSVFDKESGKNTIKEIIKELDSAKTVIIDTSGFSGATEILIGSIIASELLSLRKYNKTTGELNGKPVISIILEEAPRVLGKEVLENGPNIFSTLAREGRKFRVGLYAITQLPSLIPRQILANMNTKIILGIEMAPERQAIIESASQDLSDDARSIASLDKGEAIISSNFAKFAMPIKIPLFKKTVVETQNEFNKKKYSDDSKSKKNYSGINLSK